MFKSTLHTLYTYINFTYCYRFFVMLYDSRDIFIRIETTDLSAILDRHVTSHNDIIPRRRKIWISSRHCSQLLIVWRPMSIPICFLIQRPVPIRFSHVIHKKVCQILPFHFDINNHSGFLQRSDLCYRNNWDTFTNTYYDIRKCRRQFSPFWHYSAYLSKIRSSCPKTGQSCNGPRCSIRAGALKNASSKSLYSAAPWLSFFA